jgi:hypothetical protein
MLSHHVLHGWNNAHMVLMPTQHGACIKVVWEIFEGSGKYLKLVGKSENFPEKFKVVGKKNYFIRMHVVFEMNKEY